MSQHNSSAATVAGTKRYFERIQDAAPSGPPTPVLSLAPAKLGRTGLMVSRIGFGGYRIHEHDPDHRDALKQALLSGINLIDTSLNYTDGSSERLIGTVLLDMINDGRIRRDEVCIITKAGFIQGSTMQEAKRLRERGELWPDVIELPNDVWHSISPEFLHQSISQSLDRLKVETIDGVMVHNPEVFFKASSKNIDDRKQFYKRMLGAFKHLEAEVQRGRIRFYGVSSNGFPEPENQSTHVSLKKLLDVAREAAGSDDHHFSVIEFPFNIFESNPLLYPQQNGEPLLSVAKKAELGVLTNRPLNSLREGRVIRLAAFRDHDPVFIKGELHAALGRAIELEREHPFRPKDPPQGVRWAHELREPLAELSDVLAWRDFSLTKIYPSIRSAMARVPGEAQPWRIQYENAISRLLDLVTFDLECLANSRALLLIEQLDQLVPKLKTSQTLSSRCLSLYTAIPQISSVLVGMRKPDYVADACSVRDPLEEKTVRDVLHKLQRHRS